MSPELCLTSDLYVPLQSHLFRADRDEHAAVVLAGVHEARRGTRLLARELHLVPPEAFPPSQRGYRQTSPKFVAELALRASSERLAYVALHSHPTAGRVVALSPDDLSGHQRLFPHLLSLVAGPPIAGLALGTESAAGELWKADAAPVPLSRVRVLGDNLLQLTDRPPHGKSVDPRFDRQARLFGAAGQAILGSLHVAVVGAGGGGSMLVEQLAHLGIGELTVFDFDVVKDVNLSRIVGATAADVGSKKIVVAERLAARIDPGIRFNGVDGDIADLETAAKLLDADFIFLATDTITSRLVFNAAVHRFLIPGVQIGAKVDVDRSGKISQMYVAVRPVRPDYGCLNCNSLIDPMRLQEEARSSEEQSAQNYLNEAEVIDPSVISLNGLAASHAVNVLLLAVTGLGEPGLFEHRLIFPRTGQSLAVSVRRADDCPFCSHEASSMLAKGGSASALPCRRSN